MDEFTVNNDFNAAAPPPPPLIPAMAPASPPPIANKIAGDNQYEIPTFGMEAAPPPPPPPVGKIKSHTDIQSDSLASHKGRISAQGETGKSKGTTSKLITAAMKKFKGKKSKSRMDDAESGISTLKKVDDEDENIRDRKKLAGNLKYDIIVTVILVLVFLLTSGGVIGAVSYLSKGKFGKFKF